MKTDHLPTHELTDEQRRILAAEAMGWTWEGGKRNKRFESQRILSPDRNKAARFWRDGINALVHLPDPDQQPADALALVEKLRGEGWACELSTLADGWECVFGKQPTEPAWGYDLEHCATEPTFCRAVVSSFLKAKGVAR